MIDNQTLFEFKDSENVHIEEIETFGTDATSRNSTAESTEDENIFRMLKDICWSHDLRLEKKKCTKDGKNAYWFKYGSGLTHGRYRGEKKNNGRDSKSMDSFYVIRNNEKSLSVFGFYKYTKNSGGHQGNVSYEITTTLDRIHEDSEHKNILVIFYLCGNFWEKDDSVFDDIRFQDNRLIGLRPKTNLTDKKELLEKRIINFFNKQNDDE